MNTLVNINEELINEAKQYSGLKSKKKITEEALKVFILLNKQSELKSLWGKINWTGNLELMRKDNNANS